MSQNQYSASDQVAPTPNDRPACWQVVIQDLKTSFESGHRIDELTDKLSKETSDEGRARLTKDAVLSEMMAIKLTEEYTDSTNALVKDMGDRDTWGRSKYGVPLQPFNGRDALIDLYQEFLDATVYTKQYQLENPTDIEFNNVYRSLLESLYFVRKRLLLRDGK